MTDPSFASPQHDTASRAAEPPKGDDWISPPKFIFITAIALATLIPNYFVSGLIAERESRQDVVENEFVLSAAVTLWLLGRLRGREALAWSR